MKKCKDCGQEAPLTSFGTCKQCQNRKFNMKHRGQEYIPIVKLPIEEQQKILNRRKGKAQKSSTPTININKASTEESALINKIARGNKKLYQEILHLLNIDELEIEKQVEEDIEKEFTRRNVEMQEAKQYNLAEAYEIVCSSLCEDDYYNQYRASEQILTDLVNDYQHKKENTDISNLRDFIVISMMEQKAARSRRPYKNKINQLKCTEKLRVYATEHPELLEMFNEARIELINEINRQSNPIYISKASELILGTGNVQPEKRPVPLTKQKYNVWVEPCYNLYGNRSGSKFQLNNGTYATSPEEAKQILKRVLTKDFPDVTYKDIDIKVELMDDKVQKEGA